MQTQPDNLRNAERATETRPAYLYHFIHGGTAYYITNYDRDIVTTGSIERTWTAGQVGHELGEGSAELSQRQATVALGILDAEFRKHFLTAPPQRATVAIYRLNSGALPGPLDFAANAFMEFSGVALGPSFSDATIAITFASELAQEDRAILRFNYQPQCNHVIYGGGCFVDRNAHKITKTVSLANRANRYIECAIATVPNASGGTTPVTAQSFEGGYLLEVATGNLVGIVSSALLGGGMVRLFLQWWPTTMLAGVSVTLFKGCRHTKAGCTEDFDNLDGQFGIVTELTVDGSDVVGLVPLAWRPFAARHAVCVPLVGGAPIGQNDWTFEPTNGQIRILATSNTTAGRVKLPRIGGFGGHPYIPVNNPSTDGI